MTERISLQNGSLSALFAASPVGPRPLLVLVHGATYTGAYFDIPGASLLERGAAAGFDVLAVDRPGHSSSPELDRGPNLLTRNANVIRTAVDEFAAQRGYADVVVLGHSIGGAIAILLAAQQPPWLRGLAISGVGIRPELTLAKMTRPLSPFLRRMCVPRRVKHQMMFGPTGTYDPTLAKESLARASEPSVVQEFMDIAFWWPRRLPTAAATVAVPVHARLAEHDALWDKTPQAARDFGALFSGSAEVSSELYVDTGHCIDHHNVGPAFHAMQLEFAKGCLN